MFEFKRYLAELQQLDVRKTLLVNNCIVVLLSGSSHYQHASLTQEQLHFLSYFRQFGYQVITSNFPYNQDFDHKQTNFPSLFQASLNNIDYYGHTLWHKAFHKELERHLRPLFDLKDVILVTQSSGLNMLTQILEENAVKSSVKVVALGPVSQKKISLQENVWIIKGKKDYYSRLLDRNSITNKVPCTHHNYLVSASVKEVLDGIIQD